MAADAGDVSMLALFDLSVASDMVDHSILLQKLIQVILVELLSTGWLAVEARVSDWEASLHLPVRFHMVCCKALLLGLFCSIYILLIFLILLVNVALDVSVMLMIRNSIFT